MGVSKKISEIGTKGKGTYEITNLVSDGLRESGFSNGMVSVFVQHTSCSLVIMENADPTARVDLERFMEELVPEDYPNFVHTLEGPDDMPSHIKMALTRTSEQIPFANGQLQLGSWQGLFLWEHRSAPHNRRLILTYLGE
ncbi:secondary thiamine-phosphate synthase enzyme YjbQ [Opitutales bacterium]|jgi:secondary thiamine-phosphate synthase enzyme|nr:secondary thiamine-phosphate synthase enzyme YjbQ [Opitutales bacterium]MDB3958123.1 secondary thiamine-phosphate synthase enzyme YjbQ [Opitutales bacterium]MDC3282648.1 secondary thiamine-phosphate synthase enzyme YjbQ [Opitutales bacterium]